MTGSHGANADSGDEEKRRHEAEARAASAARDWRPSPADTTAVEITPEIADLTEVLASNTHENWAHQRLVNGWRWGPRRDDERREHPCLVAYDDLPEEEKAFDRRTALETIRLLLALGYRIVKG